MWAGLWWELWAGARLTATCGKKQGLLGTVERRFLRALIWTKNVPFWPQTEVSLACWNRRINRAIAEAIQGAVFGKGAKLDSLVTQGTSVDATNGILK